MAPIHAATMDREKPTNRAPKAADGILLAINEAFTHFEGMTRMFSRVRIAIRFFFMGLAVGILLAPRSGAQTRQLVREKADQLLNDVLDAATLGSVDDGSARSAGTRGATADAATVDAANADDGETTPRSRNGRGRSRAAGAAQA